MFPEAKLVNAWVAALMSRSLCSVRAPLAWVLVRARLNWMSGASVEAVRPVSAPPMTERKAEAPEGRAASLRVREEVAVIAPPKKEEPEMCEVPLTESVLEGLEVPTPKVPK